jgi:hypothetical protein
VVHLDADFIGLHLSQVVRLLDAMRVDLFTVITGTRLPISNRALIQLEDRDYGRQGTTMCDRPTEKDIDF